MVCLLKYFDIPVYRNPVPMVLVTYIVVVCEGPTHE